MPVIELSNVIPAGAGTVLSNTGVPSGSTFVGQPPGTLVRNVSTGVIYTNTGSAATPTWIVVGAQT